MDIVFSKYYKPKPKQLLAHQCRAKYLLFGGAMGGGKSWWLAAEAIKNAMMFPGNRLVLVRKELSVIKRTILLSFFSVCPPQIIKKFNQSSLEITFINDSVLTFLEANVSNDPLLNKLKGLEIGWFGIDEGNETSIDVYRILKTRLRYVLPDGTKPRYEGRLTSNPENCWLVQTFIHSENPGEAYIQSLTLDNYEEDSDYVKNLKDAFKDSPQLLQRYLYGDWSLVDAINQLIPSSAIINCKEYLENGFGTSLGIDVARYGEDRTVFVLLKNGNIELIQTYNQTSVTQIVTKAVELISTYKIDPRFVGIDAVGIGAGVIDNLKSMGYEVTEIVGGEKPLELNVEDAFKPFNLRSQMYYELRRDIINGKIGNITNLDLIHELGAITYEISSERTVKVIGKDIIKKTLGKSPDIADAFCYANWVKELRGEFALFVPFKTGNRPWEY